MSRERSFCCICALVCSLATCWAVPPTIGIASAVGAFLVNSNPVEGNSNLFEGAEVKTGKASSQIFLHNGTALTLGINSTGTVFRDHLLLQQGATKVDNMNGFAVTTGAFLVKDAQPSSQAVVRLESDMVEVAALSGALNVYNLQGSLLTHIGAGTASAFQTGASPGRKDRSAATPNVNTQLRKEVAAALLLAAGLAALGLGVAALVQPAPTSQ